MTERDIRVLSGHPAAFVIFNLGRQDNFLVVPVKDLASHLPEYRDNLTADGRYHFNLKRRGIEFEQIPNWELRRYRDNLELIPRPTI